MIMRAFRLRFHIQNHIPLLSPLRSIFVPFSSSSYADSRVSGDGEGCNKPKFQRPSSIQWRLENFNSSFIGTVAQPLRCLRDGKVHTVLTVGDSSPSKGAFRILLQFYDEVAKMCLAYLKENDYIHVSGRLQTNIMPNQDGNLSLYYRLKVSKVNYVTGSHDVIPQSNKELQTVEDGTTVFYKDKLKFQRPSSIQWRRECCNSASFIGTVAQPLKSFREGKAYTVLTVRDLPQSRGGVWILLQFYDEMAKMCLEYLKENDYIHVSGFLKPDIKPNQNGNLSLLYRLKVREVNYVTGSHDVIPQSNKELQTVEDRPTMFYRHMLKFQRPSLIQWRPEYLNSSFIGTVDHPLKCFKEGKAHTMLIVQDPYQSEGIFRIMLLMWGQMAKMCLKYLKEKDYIYVSGHLRTGACPVGDGNFILCYRLMVDEVNYVTISHDGIPQSKEELQTAEGRSTLLEKSSDRLHLWQSFFSSPHKWWDNRNCKTNPNKPDFRHKDTGEVLWLKPNDPPWVFKQIQLLDSRLGERGDSEPVGSRARLSDSDYDESYD